MRKQTKLVAVASAAALLAIGASMTSFAATGWVEEAGQWFYYDKDGDKVEDEWKKSGDNWYWLASEEDGAMATDYLVEDGDYLYYVDANGVMVRNTWVKMVNEDQDEDSDPAEYRYYYFGSNGRAYENDDAKIKLKTIDGKKYAFDADGKMLYGWVTAQNEMKNEEQSWDEGLYFMGSWEDGAMKTGWQKISVYNEDDEENQDKWFYFNTNGQKFVNKKDKENTEVYDTKKINGKTYGFDENGIMVYEWKSLVADDASGSNATASNWAWFNSPEDGARVTKGWFKVVPSAKFDPKNSADDEDTAQWYYGSGDGTLLTSQIKKINGKYYGFKGTGAMMTGLWLLEVDDENKIVYNEAIDADELGDIKSGDMDVPVGATLYYFGEGDDADTDGAMRTGNTTVKLDGDNYSFRFLTTDGIYTRGGGFTGESKDVHYKYGLKMTVSSDDKYQAAEIENIGTGEEAIEDVLTLTNGADFRRELKGDAYEVAEYGDEKISYVVADGSYVLVGTSGKIVENKSGVKDGEDWYFYTDKAGRIMYYANSKNLKKALGTGYGIDFDADDAE